MIGHLAGKAVDAIGAIWVLCTLAFVSKFRFKGAYWGWRMSTAFPKGSGQVGGFERARGAFEYARWAWRIRRLR